MRRRLKDSKEIHLTTFSAAMFLGRPPPACQPRAYSSRQRVGSEWQARWRSCAHVRRVSLILSLDIRVAQP